MKKQISKFKKTLVLLMLTGIITITPARYASAQSIYMSYLFGGTTKIYTENVSKSDDVLNAVSPDYFNITAAGDLYPNYNVDRTFVESMHAGNIKVTPFLSNHWDREQGNAALNNIEALTNQLKDIVYEYNIDGINVDIENVNETYRDKYTLLVKTLREKLPDKEISVAVAANPKGWTLGWHGSYDYAKLAQYSDYLMIMGYDESYYGGSAGPVASSKFVEDSIKYALKYTTPDKIVLGIPFFGRYWKASASIGGNGITSADVENLIKNYSSKKTYDEDSQSAAVTLTVKSGDKKPVLWGGTTLGEGIYTIWYDDMKATEHKLQLAKKYGINGVGSWALGQEVEEVWNLFKTYTLKLKFLDIGKHWAHDKISFVYEKGWMTGMDQYTFLPEGNLTRAQAAAILVRVCNLQSDPGGQGFADTKNHWASKEISIAKKYGLVTGTGNDLFQPDRQISRRDIAVMLERVFVLSNAIDFNENKFSDVKSSDYAYNAIIKLANNFILEGYENGTFKPGNSITRAEMASVLNGVSGFGVAEFNLSAKKPELEKHDIVEPR